MDKAHILAEIKRTAEKNGGTALGWRRFFKETGIGYHDWFGRYWVRWSDAVKEAGCGSSSFAKGYGEEALVQHFIVLTRELGHVPIRGEILLKCRKDPSFPSEKAFRRLGNKPRLLSRIAEYCHGKPGFEDIVELCDKKQATPVSTATTDRQTADIEIGCVYLVRSGRYYKIGKSNSIGRREYELALQLPEKATTVHVIRTDDPTGIEAYWHRRFEAKRKNGEWFNLDRSDVQAFKRRTFM